MARNPNQKPTLDTTTGPAGDDDERISHTGPAGADQHAVVAEADVFIERADLGPGCYTRVVAGDPIPLALRGLPSRPAATLKGGSR